MTALFLNIMEGVLMLLVIDMGNTNIELGGFDGDDILFRERISTDLEKTELEYAVLIKTVIELYGIHESDVTGCIISSVVPPLTHIIKTAVKKIISVTPIKPV